MSDANKPGVSSGDPRAEPTLPRFADSCRSAAAPPLLPDSSGPLRPPDPAVRYACRTKVWAVSTWDWALKRSRGSSLLQGFGDVHTRNLSAALHVTSIRRPEW